MQKSNDYATLLNDDISKLRDYHSRCSNNNLDDNALRDLISNLKLNMSTSLLRVQDEWDKETIAAAQHLLDFIPKYHGKSRGKSYNTYIESLAVALEIDLKSISSMRNVTQNSIANTIKDIKQKFKENDNIQWFLLLLSNPASAITTINFDFDEDSTTIRHSDLENRVDHINSMTFKINKDYKELHLDQNIPDLNKLTDKNIEDTFNEITNTVLLDILLTATIELSSIILKKGFEKDQFKMNPGKFSDYNSSSGFSDKDVDHIKYRSFSLKFKDECYPQILAPWFFYVFHRTKDKATIDGNDHWSINRVDYKERILPYLSHCKNEEKEKFTQHLVLDLKKIITHLYTSDQDINKSLCLYILNINTSLISSLILAMYTDGNKIKPIIRRKVLRFNKYTLRKIPNGEYENIKKRFSISAKAIEIDNRLCMAKLISPGLVFRFLGNKERDHYIYHDQIVLAIYRIQRAMFDLISFCLFKYSPKNDEYKFNNLDCIYTHLKDFDPYVDDSDLIKELVTKLERHEQFPLNGFIHSYERFEKVFKKAGKFKKDHMWF